MDSANALLEGLASGDSAPLPQTTSLAPALKREQDSTDDFEHLEREAKPAGESPLHEAHHPRAATQSFLDMERDVFVDTPPRAPSVTDKLDHIADKFTDSESDADTAGESPLHRPAPAVPAQAPAPAPAPAPVPAPLLDLLSDPLPATVLAPVTPPLAPAEKPAPAPLPELKPVPAPATEPVKPAPAVAPHQPAPKLVPAEPARAPIAHVIEAEVIFCQMGLGKY